MNSETNIVAVENVDVTTYPEGAKAVASYLDFLPDEESRLDFLMLAVELILFF